MYKATDRRPEKEAFFSLFFKFFASHDLIVESGQTSGSYLQRCIGYKSPNQNYTVSKAESAELPWSFVFLFLFFPHKYTRSK